MFSVGDLFSQASPIGRAMQSPTRSPMTFFDGQGTTEPTTERTERAQIASERNTRLDTRNLASQFEAYKAAVGTPLEDQGAPLPAHNQVRLRDRDLGAHSATSSAQAMQTATPHATRRMRTDTSPPEQWMEHAAHRAGPLLPSFTPGARDSENLAGNRFGGNEICEACEQPHTDANYVATDAYGFSFCGDCWDASLGATVIVRCAFPPGEHLCECGTDLRQERWFAATGTHRQMPYCHACCLSFWGFTEADMIVSAIEDRPTDPLEQEGGAHLHSSMLTPYDDTSPTAGLSDRGFSIGLVPRILEGCMNLSPRTGESRRLDYARVAHTHTRRHTCRRSMHTARTRSRT